MSNHYILDESYMDQVKERVNRAIQHLIERDAFLLVYDVNERSIAHMLALHLQQEFEDWHVDCEYNRDGPHKPKRLPRKEKIYSDDVNARTVFPDIIVHHRGERCNLLVIEIKKTTNAQSNDNDIAKLRLFKSDMEYAFALFLRLRTDCAVDEVRIEEQCWI